VNSNNSGNADEGDNAQEHGRNHSVHLTEPQPNVLASDAPGVREEFLEEHLEALTRHGRGETYQGVHGEQKTFFLRQQKKKKTDKS
jgi:hypothetical protein